MAVQAMKEGAFEFIQKPFRDQDLLDRINHALKQDAENRGTVARRAEVLHRLESLTPRESHGKNGRALDCSSREAALDAEQ
jgi:FixJ family two-component response regulator